MAPRSSSPLLSPAQVRRGSTSSSGKQISPSASSYRTVSPGLMTSPKLWQKRSISRLAEEFFWIGGSVVATPKWRLGQFGNSCHDDHECL